MGDGLIRPKCIVSVFSVQAPFRKKVKYCVGTIKKKKSMDKSRRIDEISNLMSCNFDVRHRVISEVYASVRMSLVGMSGAAAQ